MCCLMSHYMCIDSTAAFFFFWPCTLYFKIINVVLVAINEGATHLFAKDCEKLEPLQAYILLTISQAQSVTFR